MLYWTIVVMLGAFCSYFTFANYPIFATAVVLVLLLLLGLSEWKRQANQSARDEERRRERARMR